MSFTFSPSLKAVAGSFGLFRTHNFVVTHHTVSHHLSNTTLSHLGQTSLHDTASVTHHFVTGHLSTTTVQHNMFQTQLLHTRPFVTTTFVTHHLSHTPGSHTTWSHTAFHTQLCHTPSFTHIFFTHHLSHTTLSHLCLAETLSHTIWHTPSCQAPSLTHYFVTYHLSHTALSLATWNTNHPSHIVLSHGNPVTHCFCHTASVKHTSSVTHFFPHLFHTALSHASLTGHLSHRAPSITWNSVTHHLCHTACFKQTHNIGRHKLCHPQPLPHHLADTSLPGTTVSQIICHTLLCHTHHSPHVTSFTQNSVTDNLVTHIFVTHHVCHTELCRTPSFTHGYVIFVRRHLSHTPSLSHLFFSRNFVTHLVCHTFFVPQHIFTHNFLLFGPPLLLSYLCHTNTHTHTHLYHMHFVMPNFAIHHRWHTNSIFRPQLCHTPFLSHTIFHPQLCHMQLCPFIRHIFVRAKGTRTRWQIAKAFFFPQGNCRKYAESSKDEKVLHLSKLTVSQLVFVRFPWLQCLTRMSFTFSPSLRAVAGSFGLFRTHNSVTHHLCLTPSFTNFCHMKSLSHILFVTRHLSNTHSFGRHNLGHTPSIRHKFARHASHVICHTPFATHTHNLAHTPLFHAPSLTHNFVTHQLSPTALSHATLSIYPT